MSRRFPTTFNSLGQIAAAREQWDGAARSFDEERRATRRYIANILPLLPPTRQLDFLRAETGHRLDNALTLAWKRRPDVHLAEMSAGWLLNSKGIAHESLAERALLVRDAATPALRPVVRELRAVREQQASLALAAAAAGQEEARRRQLEQLAARQQDLEKELRRGSSRVLGGERWIELAAVRAALPPDALLVNIARFRVAHYTARTEAEYWQPARYAAWLVPATGQGDVRIVDLGESRARDDSEEGVNTRVVTRARFPAKRLARFDALLTQLLLDANRGLIAEGGSRVGSKVTKVAFALDPKPVMSVTLVYYRRVNN